MAYQWAGEARLTRGRRSEVEYWAARAGPRLIAVGDAVKVRRVNDLRQASSAGAAHVGQAGESEDRNPAFLYALIESLLQRGDVMAARVRWLISTEEAIGMLAVSGAAAMRSGYLPHSPRGSPSKIGTRHDQTRPKSAGVSLVEILLEAEKALLDGAEPLESDRAHFQEKKCTQVKGDIDKRNSHLAAAKNVVLSYERDCVPLSSVVGPVRLLFPPAVQTPVLQSSSGQQENLMDKAIDRSEQALSSGVGSAGYFAGPSPPVRIERNPPSALVPLQELLHQAGGQSSKVSNISQSSEADVNNDSSALGGFNGKAIETISCAKVFEPRLLSVRSIPASDVDRIMASADHNQVRAAAALSFAVLERSVPSLSISLPPVDPFVERWASLADAMLQPEHLRQVANAMRVSLEDDLLKDGENEGAHPAVTSHGAASASDGASSHGAPEAEAEDYSAGRVGGDSQPSMTTDDLRKENANGDEVQNDKYEGNTSDSSDEDEKEVKTEAAPDSTSTPPTHDPARPSTAADHSQQLRMRAAGNDEDSYRRTRVGPEYQATWMPDTLPKPMPTLKSLQGKSSLDPPARGGTEVNPEESDADGPSMRSWSPEDLDVFAVLVTQYGKEFHRIAALLNRPTTDVVNQFYARKRWRQQRLGPVDQAAREATELAAKARAEAEAAREESEAEAASGEFTVGPGRRRSARAATRAARAQGAAAVGMESLTRRVPGAWFVGRGQALCSLCLDVFETGALLWCSVSSCRRTICGRCFRVDVETYRTRRSHVRFELARMQPFWSCLDCCPPPFQMLGGAHNGGGAARLHAAAAEALARRANRGMRYTGEVAGNILAARAGDAPEVDSMRTKSPIQSRVGLLSALASVVPCPPEGAAEYAQAVGTGSSEDMNGGDEDANTEPGVDAAEDSFDVDPSELGPGELSSRLQVGGHATGVFMEVACAPAGAGTGLILPAGAAGEDWPVVGGIPRSSSHTHSKDGDGSADEDEDGESKDQQADPNQLPYGARLAGLPPRAGMHYESAREQDFWRRVARAGNGAKSSLYPPMPAAVRATVDPEETLQQAAQTGSKRSMQQRAALLHGIVGRWGGLTGPSASGEGSLGRVLSEEEAADPFSIQINSKSSKSGVKAQSEIATSIAATRAGGSTHKARTRSSAPGISTRARGLADRFATCEPPPGDDPQKYRAAVLKAADEQAAAVVAHALAVAPGLDETVPGVWHLNRTGRASVAQGGRAQRDEETDAKSIGPPLHFRRPSRAESRHATTQQDAANSTVIGVRDAAMFWQALESTFGAQGVEMVALRQAAQALKLAVDASMSAEAVRAASQQLVKAGVMHLRQHPTLAAAMLPFVEPSDREDFVRALQRSVLGTAGIVDGDVMSRARALGGSIARDAVAIDAASTLGAALKRQSQ